VTLLLWNQDAQTHSTLEIQAELNGAGQGWTFIESDVQRVPSITLDYGIGGAGPTDLVASTGRLTFALNNGPGNSANLLGYYSPGHANCRSGFAIGIGIRLVYRLSGVTYYKFAGTLDSVEPISGLYGERKTLCTVVDWMSEAAIYRPNVATQLSKRVDEIMTTLVAAVPRQPLATSFETGASTFTYSLDNDLNERDPVMTIMQRLAQSENCRMYVKGDTNTGGVLTSESKTTRYTASSVATFNDTMVSLSAPFDRNLIVNRVKTTTHPRTVDAAATTILFTLTQVSPSIHSVASGATLVLEGDYSDANNRTSRVGGTEMVTPAATVDYTMNTLASGGGTDLTASFTVSAEYGSNRVRYTIVNGSASTGYITKLQARGKGLYDYTPVDNIATDSESITSYGQRELAFDMPYESSVGAAQETGDYILSLWASPAAVAAAMPLVPPTNTDLATMIAREPGQAITITESVTGINTDYFINHVSMRFEDYQTIYFEWILQKATRIPVVRSRTTSAESTNQTNHDVTMPSGVEVGDLLLCIFTCDDASPSTANPTFPVGWITVGEFWAVLTPEALTMMVACKVADGTEGSSIVVTTAVAQESTHATYRIVGAADPGVTPPEAAEDNDPGSTLAMPPLLTPAGGTQNYLWLFAVGISIQGGVANGTVPSEYRNSQFVPATTDGWSTLCAERVHRAASEQPGTIELSADREWMALTISVPPAAN
jgi:hypothetical protein